jgi:UrcA family protein
MSNALLACGGGMAQIMAITPDREFAMIRFAFAAAFLTFALPLPALAHDRLPDVAVRTADLDLASPFGTNALDQRISEAASKACPSLDGIREVARIALVDQCRAAKIAEAQPLRTAAIARATPRQDAVALAR